MIKEVILKKPDFQNLYNSYFPWNTCEKVIQGTFRNFWKLNCKKIVNREIELEWVKNGAKSPSSPLRCVSFYIFH